MGIGNRPLKWLKLLSSVQLLLLLVLSVLASCSPLVVYGGKR
jgi:hypothetical protein